MKIGAVKNYCLLSVIIFVIAILFVDGCGGNRESLKLADSKKTDDPGPQPTQTPTTSGDLQLDSPPHVGMTFISTGNLIFQATILNNNRLETKEVKWNILAFEVTSETAEEYWVQPTTEPERNLTGLYQTVRPNPAIAVTGRPYRLYYEINVGLNVNGVLKNTIETYIVQDIIDQCRQEYVDFSRASVPTRDDFTNSSGSENFTLAELADSTHEAHKQYATYIQPSLTTGLEDMRTRLGNTPIAVNFAYRWPSTQYQASTAAEGNHQYGIAADLYVPGGTENAWTNMREQAKKAGACVEPADYAFPGKPDYSYIHVDWRGTCPINW